MKRAFKKSTRLFVPCVAFPGPGNIYKPNLAPIAFWRMQARHRPSKAAVAHSEVLVRSFRLHLQIWHCCCEDNIIHDNSYLLSTYRCWFICETPSVLAHSVMLYYILQTLLLPNWGSGDETRVRLKFFSWHAEHRGSSRIWVQLKHIRGEHFIPPQTKSMACNIYIL